ncbi:uncharacterized protein Bfra_004085 [Botrytis fragariae]|uniref:Uncharacterized protein n=1 Tax=Botrytis fragariae TaxID=1964551 RepID=A0A8H6AV06_9HELO|nr:uncharacterized protein Bfra_004085 [Botrytis fragariae]KAF5874078.1 hypothetical protein Bfra_004085 [Botrytis fragariae]
MAVVTPWKWISSSARGVFMAGGLKMRIRWEIIELGSYSRYKEQGFELKSTVQTRQARFRMRITTSRFKMFKRIDVQRYSVYTWQTWSLHGDITSYHTHAFQSWGWTFLHRRKWTSSDMTPIPGYCLPKSLYLSLGYRHKLPKAKPMEIGIVKIFNFLEFLTNLKAAIL